MEGLLSGPQKQPMPMAGWVILFPRNLSGAFDYGSFGAPKLKTYNAMTMASVFGRIYESKLLRILSAYLSFITLFFILVAIAVCF